MEEATKETKRPEINWNYVILGGAALGAIALVLAVVKEITSEDEERRKLAEQIFQEWVREWYEVEPYMKQIYLAGTPTEEQTLLLGQMLDQMKWKELNISSLSKTTWAELVDLARQIGIALGVVGGTVVAYVAIKTVNNWINKNRPPPNFPCPKCDQVFATEGALKYHIETGHTINPAGIDYAQQAFLKSPLFAQYYVATQTGYYNQIYVPWKEIAYVLIGVGVAIAIIYSAGLIAPHLAVALKTGFAYALI